MNRHFVRTVIMQLIYADMMGGEERQITLATLYEGKELSSQVHDLVMETMAGIDHYGLAMDSVIDTFAKGWSAERLPRVDLAILRLGLYEMLFRDKVSAAVAINEGVELAREFSDPDSTRYINGILSSCLKQIEAGELTRESLAVLAETCNEVARLAEEERLAQEEAARLAAEQARQAAEKSRAQDAADDLLDAYDMQRIAKQQRAFREEEDA